MQSFRNFFNKTGAGVEHRHMKDVVPDASSHPQSPGKTVPEYMRTKNKNQKVEQLKRQQRGRIPLNKSDVAQIQSEFQAQLDINKPKKLGNTGITLRYDASINAPILEK